MRLPLVPDVPDLNSFRVPEHPAARALELLKNHVQRWTKAIVEAEAIATSGLELVSEIQETQTKLRSEHERNEIPDADELEKLTSRRERLLVEMEEKCARDGAVKEAEKRMTSDVAVGVQAIREVLGAPEGADESSHAVFEALFERVWSPAALELLKPQPVTELGDGESLPGERTKPRATVASPHSPTRRHESPGNDIWQVAPNTPADEPAAATTTTTTTSDSTHIDVCSDLCALRDGVSVDASNIARLLAFEREFSTKRTCEAVRSLGTKITILRDLFCFDIDGRRNPDLGCKLRTSLDAFFHALQEVHACDSEFRQPITSRFLGPGLQRNLSKSFQAWLAEASRLIDSIIPRLQRLACEAERRVDAHKALETYRRTFLATVEASSRLKTLPQPKQGFIDDLRAQIAAFGNDDGSARASFEESLRHALRQQQQFSDCAKIINDGLAYLRAHEADFPEFDVRPLFALDSTALRRLGVPLGDLLVVRSLSEYQDVSELSQHARCLYATYDGIPCFLKQFHVDHPSLPSVLKREVRVLRNVRSRYVLSPLCAFYQQSDRKLYFHYPRLDRSWAEHIELLNKQFSFSTFGVEQQSLLDLWIMLAMGLEDLHRFHLIHGDISLKNAMLSVRENNAVDRGCWIDFSESIDVTTQTCNVNATRQYLPPEGRGVEHFKPTKASDIFAFGTCIVESCRPFPCAPWSAILAFASGKMCHADPTQRPSSSEVVIELDQQRKKIFAEMDVLVRKLSVETFEFNVPFYWTHKNSWVFGGSAPASLPLTPSGGIRSPFMERLVLAVHPTLTNTITRVERIENVPMWRAYRAECSKLKAQLQALHCWAPDTSMVQHLLNEALQESSRVSMEPAFGEMFLFHGTSARSLTTIARDGFDPAYASKGLLGQGCYFSPSLEKALYYARKNADGVVIIARVALGKMQNVGKTSQGDRRRPDNGYHSIVGTPLDHLECVVYGTNRAYAEFVVHLS